MPKPKPIFEHIRYEKTKHGEHLYMGQKIRFDKLSGRTTYPLGFLRNFGRLGSLVFEYQPKFQNLFDIPKNEHLRFMENNSGLYLVGTRSFQTGAAAELLKRVFVIAQYRGAKYLYLEETDPRVERLVLNQGFKLVGKNNLGNNIYIKYV
jgi:hypothetical protein